MASYKSGKKDPRSPFHKEGDYLVAVINAEEKTSKKGSEMIELKLEVIGPDVPEGTGAIFHDYLVFQENMAWKIDDFRRALGQTVSEETDDGEDVEIEASDLEGESFEAHLIVEVFNSKNQNKVGGYIEPDADAEEKPKKSKGVGEDGEPF